MEFPILFKLFLYIIIIFSAVIHEYAHAWVAYQEGDPTAKYSGRLTLNPLPHIDLWGTVIIPLFLLFSFGGFIGWAKPVPFNPYNLKDQKYGIAKVAIAGPLANFSIALLFGIFLRFTSILTLPLSLIVYINIFLGLFNLLPFPPLDGSKLAMVFFPELERNLSSTGFLGIFLAIIFALFILSPLSNLIYYLIVGQPFTFS